MHGWGWTHFGACSLAHIKRVVIYAVFTCEPPADVQISRALVVGQAGCHPAGVLYHDLAFAGAEIPLPYRSSCSKHTRCHGDKCLHDEPHSGDAAIKTWD